LRKYLYNTGCTTRSSVTEDHNSLQNSQRKLPESWGTKWPYQWPYHPQMDRQTEQYNQTLETFLRIYCTSNPEKWKQYLFLVEFAHNSQVHSSTNKSPYEIILGYRPKALLEAQIKSTVEGVEERLNDLMRMRKCQLHTN
jgi:hypothetical protein